jgi:hypothetical protein
MHRRPAIQPIAHCPALTRELSKNGMKKKNVENFDED